MVVVQKSLPFLFLTSWSTPCSYLFIIFFNSLLHVLVSHYIFDISFLSQHYITNKINTNLKQNSNTKLVHKPRPFLNIKKECMVT